MLNKTEFFQTTQENDWLCCHTQDMLKENVPVVWQAVSSPGRLHKVCYGLDKHVHRSLMS